MGRVFSFEELSARQVPTDADFEASRQVFSEFVEDAVGVGLIRGAMIFGSAAIKKTNARSDLDCFIVLDQDNESSWGAAVDIVEATKDASDGRIPVGAIGRPADWLLKRRHELDRFFGAHLSGPHRIVIGDDPARYMTFNTRPAIEVVEDFMVAKSRKLSEFAWTDNPIEILHALQRTLELPNAVGRKALRAVDEMEGTNRSIENSADKKLVGNASIELFSELGTESHALALLEADRQYNEVIAAVLSGEMNETEYAKVLHGLGEKVVPSIGWIIRTYEALEKRIGHRDHPLL